MGERCYSKPFISCKLLPRNVRKPLVLVVGFLLHFVVVVVAHRTAHNFISLVLNVRVRLAVEYNFTLGGIIIYIWCGYSWRCVKNVWNRMCGYMAIKIIMKRKTYTRNKFTGNETEYEQQHQELSKNIAARQSRLI